jgi:hypothetical protein
MQSFFHQYLVQIYIRVHSTAIFGLTEKLPDLESLRDLGRRLGLEHAEELT